MDTRLVSFSVELSLNVSPQMFDFTLSMTEPQILSPWFSVPTKSIKGKFPPSLPSTTYTQPQKIVLFLPSKLLPISVATPNALQPLVLAMAVLQLLPPPHAVLINLTSAGIIKIMLTELRNVELCVPNQKSSCPAGVCLHPT